MPHLRESGYEGISLLLNKLASDSFYGEFLLKITNFTFHLQDFDRNTGVKGTSPVLVFL